jgi:hypothetical protein
VVNPFICKPHLPGTPYRLTAVASVNRGKFGPAKRYSNITQIIQIIYLGEQDYLITVLNYIQPPLRGGFLQH